MKIPVEQIAKTAYEAVRALGCDLQSWDVASAEDKNEALDSVMYLLENPDLGAKEMYCCDVLEILKENPDYDAMEWEDYDAMEWEDLDENEQAMFKVFFSVVDSLRLSAVR